MKILALETSSDACSVALAVGGEIIERFQLAPRGHSQLILPMAEQVLAEAGIGLAQLDALAFGRGPGAFTGVRIAVGVAQGIAFGAGLPVVPVSSLAALAQACDHEQVLVAVDARMDEVYWGAFRRNPAGLVELCGEEAVLAPDQVSFPTEGEWFGVGSGWEVYEARLGGHGGARLLGHESEALPRAQAVALLGLAGFAAGQAVSAEEALPVYLRDKVAWKKSGAV